jgi:hypothetical protein
MVMPNFYTGPSGFHRGDSARTSLPETLAQILEIRQENINALRQRRLDTSRAIRDQRVREQQLADRKRESEIQAMGAGPGVRFGQQIRRMPGQYIPRTQLSGFGRIRPVGWEPPDPREERNRFARAQEPPSHRFRQHLDRVIPQVLDLAPAGSGAAQDAAQRAADEWVAAGAITPEVALQVLGERFDTRQMQTPGEFRTGIKPFSSALEAWGKATDIGAGVIRDPFGVGSETFGLGIGDQVGFYPREGAAYAGEVGRSPSGVNVNLPFIGNVDVVREIARLGGDPANVLPVIGFAPDILRLIRTGTLSRTAGTQAAAGAAQQAAGAVPPVRPQIPIPPGPTAEALRAQAEAAGAAVSTYPTPAIQRAPTPSPIPAAPPVAAAVEPTPLVPRAAPTAGELMAQTPAIRNVPGAVEEVVEAPALAGGAGRFEMEPTIRAGGVAATDITPHGDALTLVKKQAAEANETVPAGVVDALDYAATLREADAPQLLPNLLDRPGPIAKGRALITRIRGITQRIAETNIGAESTRAHLLTRAFATRQPLIDEASRLFGKDVVFGNARSSIARNFESLTNPFQRQAADNLAGSILHILQHPQLYNLSDAQRAFILELNTRNNDLLHLVQDSYGVKIGQLEPDPGAAFLSHIDTSPVARKKELDRRGRDEIAHIGGETSQERIYLTAQDRMAAELEGISTGAKVVSEGALFEPSVNLLEILERMDFQKASMASAEVYRAGIGGQTRLEVVSQAFPGLLARDRSLRTNLRNLQRWIAGASDEHDAAIQRFLGSAGNGEDYDVLAAVLGKELTSGADLAVRSGLSPGQDVITTARNLDNLNAEMARVQEELRGVAEIFRNAPTPDHELVEAGINKYFPIDEAIEIRDLLKTKTSPLVTLLTEINATVLAGDLSPILGIQGQLFFLQHPALATQRLFGMLTAAGRARDPFNAFRAAHLAEWIRANPQKAHAFSAAIGRPFAPGRILPEEFSGGLLARLPGGLGPAYIKANEGMFNAVIMNMAEVFEQHTKMLTEAGFPLAEAQAAAGDIGIKSLPMVSRSRLGESVAASAARRAPFTSIAFLRQPVALATEASVGLVKLGLRQPLTAKEQLAVRVMTTMAGTVAFLASASAASDALLTGKPVGPAVLKALRDVRFTLPGTGQSIAMGGPWRGLFRAMFPKEIEVEGVGKIMVPFAGIHTFVENRLQPGARAGRELVKNEEDFTGRQIVTGEFPLNVVEGLGHLAIGSSPLLIQGAGRSLLAGESLEDTAQQALAEFAGASLRLQSPREEEREIFRGIYERIPENERMALTEDGEVFLKGFEEFYAEGMSREIFLEYATEEEHQAISRIDGELRRLAELPLGRENDEALVVRESYRLRDEIRELAEKHKGDPAAFRHAVSASQRAFRRFVDSHGPDFGESKTEGEKNLERYFDAFEIAEAQETDQVLAREIVDELHDALFKEIGPDHTTLLLKNIYSVRDPDAPALYKELRDLQLGLAQTGYYESTPIAWALTQEAYPGGVAPEEGEGGDPNFTAGYPTFYAYKRHWLDFSRRLNLALGDNDALARENAADEFLLHGPTQDFTGTRGEVRTNWVEANPHLARQASRFGYLNLSSTRGEEAIAAEGQ